jgi:murein DD-endopeptidase MepM/ murein hydrolase activator NlpD
MTKLTFQMPKYRLEVKLTKKRKVPGSQSLIEELKSLSNIRSGNRASRVIRLVLERINIKTFLGRNIAFVALTTSLLTPAGATFAQTQADKLPESNILASAENLTTDVVKRYPFDNARLNQPFTFFHPGIDLGGPLGTPVFPIENGVVEFEEYSSYGYGNTVIVNHRNGLRSRYAHLQKIEAKVGDEVTTKTEIGTLGSTGRSTGPHVHLETYVEGKTVNPQSVLGPISN